jgi:hypothetical protein
MMVPETDVGVDKPFSFAEQQQQQSEQNDFGQFFVHFIA